MKPIMINNLEVATSQDKMAGVINVQDIPRLAEIADVHHHDQIKVHYVLVGNGTKSHAPSLHLKVDAALPLICQRCLDAMVFNTTLAFDYIVSETEPEESDESDVIDWLETSHEMNLTELIEDELLIDIPLAPRHDHDCKPLKQESGAKPNPFAVLKGKFK